jgi:hypothetical protein
MSKEEDYRRNAAETLELAQRVGSTGDRTRLLALADNWLDLAERAHRLGSRQRRKGATTLHPLVRAVLVDRVQR